MALIFWNVKYHKSFKKGCGAKNLGAVEADCTSPRLLNLRKVFLFRCIKEKVSAKYTK